MDSNATDSGAGGSFDSSTSSNTGNSPDDLASAFASFAGDDDERHAQHQTDDEGREGAAADQAGQALEAKPDPAAEGAAEGADDALVTVKVNGEDKQVKLSELTRDYQKFASATQRFEEAAGARREVETYRAQIEQERAHLGKALEFYTQQLQQFMPQPPDPRLLDVDPVSYIRQQQAYQNAVGQLQQADAARRELSQRSAAEQQQALRQELAQEAQRLTEAIPEWADAGKAQAEKAALRDYLNKAGFQHEELDQVTDHRSLVVARKAMLYDQIVAKAASTKAQVAKLPPARVQRPGVAGTALDGRTQAMQQLGRSGRVEDAAAVFESLLG